MCIDVWPEKTFVLESMTYKRVFQLVHTLLFFCAPLTVQMYCVATMMRKVHREMLVKGHANTRTSVKTKQKKVRVMYVDYKILFHTHTHRLTLSTMLCAFILSWLPYNVHKMLTVFSVYPLDENDNILFTFVCTHILAMSCVVWTPLLYFWTGQVLKQVYTKTIIVLATSFGIL
jgi:hypothetical protein